MKLIIKLLMWITSKLTMLTMYIIRETWWRKYYDRVFFTFDENISPSEHCKYCDAEEGCRNNNYKGFCPCKRTQILIEK